MDGGALQTAWPSRFPELTTERLRLRAPLPREAVATVIRYGFSVLGLHRIEAGVLPGNDASVRVLQKLRFLEEGTRRDYLYSKGRFHSLRWFSLLETDESPTPR